MLSGLRVAGDLDAVIMSRGWPFTCISDNGTELTSVAILRSSQKTNVDWHDIAHGKPIQNAFMESFDGHLTDELLKGDPVHLARPRARNPGDLEGRLQHRQTT